MCLLRRDSSWGRVPSCLSRTNGLSLPPPVFIRCEIGENCLGGNGPAGNRKGLVMFAVLYSLSEL